MSPCYTLDPQNLFILISGSLYHVTTFTHFPHSSFPSKHQSTLCFYELSFLDYDLIYIYNHMWTTQPSGSNVLDHTNIHTYTHTLYILDPLGWLCCLHLLSLQIFYIVDLFVTEVGALEFPTLVLDLSIFPFTVLFFSCTFGLCCLVHIILQLLCLLRITPFIIY